MAPHRFSSDRFLAIFHYTHKIWTYQLTLSIYFLAFFTFEVFFTIVDPLITNHSIPTVDFVTFPLHQWLTFSKRNVKHDFFIQAYTYTSKNFCRNLLIKHFHMGLKRQIMYIYFIQPKLSNGHKLFHQINHDFRMHAWL